MKKRYPTYKDSGIEWLGEIPAYWETFKIKHLSIVKRGASPRPIEDPKYFDDEGEFAWVRIADVTGSERYLEKTTQNLSELGSSLSVKQYPGDLFISIAGTVGKPIITKIKCCIHDGFIWFPDLRINKEFLYYIFSSGQPYQGLGKLGTQLNLNTDTIGDVFIPVPPRDEVDLIVGYLDREIAKIDGLIGKKERLIELLQEKRTALITQAVTKGLDPSAPLKNSGIEWLGEIPAHWEVEQLGINATMIVPMRDKPPNFDGETPWIRIEDFDGRYISDSKSGQRVSDETIRQMNLKVYPIGAVLCSCSCNMGATAIVQRPLVSNQTFIGIVLRKGFIPNYIYYLMQVAKEHLTVIATGAIQQYLSKNDFSRLRVPTLGISEQQAIADHLDQETAKIDGLIAKIQEGIGRLKEYRTALISAAVTGKIDVREA